MRPLSPGARFVLGVTTVTLLFVILGVTLSIRNYEAAVDRLVARQQQAADTAAANADRYLQDRLDVVRAIARSSAVSSQDPAVMTADFKRLDPAGLGFEGAMGWVNRAGYLEVLAPGDPLVTPLDLNDRAYVQVVRETQAPYVGQAITGRINAVPILPLVVPAFDEAGAFTGMVVASIRLDTLTDPAKAWRFGNPDVVILDRANQIIVDPGQVSVLRSVEGDPLAKRLRTRPHGVMRDAVNFEGQTGRLIASAPVTTGDWIVVIDAEASEVFAEAQRSRLLQIAALALIATVLVGGAAVIGRRTDIASSREAIAQAELYLSEARLRSLTEATTRVNWTVSPDGTLDDPAARWSTLANVPIDQLNLTDWLPYVHPDDRQPGDDAWNAGIARGEMFEFEQRVIRGDGTEREYLVRAVPVREAGRGIREWIGVDIDITSQRKAEREAHARETFARDVINSLIAFVGVLTPDGVLIEANRAALVAAGIREGDVLGKPFWETYWWSHSEQARTDLKQAIARARSGEFVRYDVDVLMAEGRLMTIDFAISSIRGPVGEVTHLVPSATDITERVIAERAVKRSEEQARDAADRLALALEAGRLSTWDWDVVNNSIVVSRSADDDQVLLPQTIEAFLESVHPDDQERVGSAIERSLEHGMPYEVEYRVGVGPDGERWVYARGEAFHDSAGRPVRIIGVNADITGRKQQEAFEQVFLANVAHDIKNPLAAAKAQVQLLSRRLRNGRADLHSVDAVLESVDSGLERMNRRIEELSDVARLRAGHDLVLRREQRDLRPLIAGIVATYQQATDRHRITLTMLDRPLTGWWDVERIERVLDNLLSNAVKYSPDGGEVSIHVAIDAAGSAIEIRVADNGIGIPAADVPFIFERYRRGGNAVLTAGTGIGLAGARQIVEQHGGSIEISTSEGVGSTFKVSLPLASPEREAISDGPQTVPRVADSMEAGL